MNPLLFGATLVVLSVVGCLGEQCADEWAYDKYKLLAATSPAQTCIGKMIRPGYEGDLAEQYSAWVQDPARKLLRFDLGQPGEEEFTQLYLNGSNSYVVVTPGNNPDFLYCMHAGVSFDSVFGAYIYPYVRYLSDGVWKGKNARFYAGSSPDPFTRTSISNVAIIGEHGEYYSMAALSSNGYIYYDYSGNVTLGQPDEDWFVPPAFCPE